LQVLRRRRVALKAAASAAIPTRELQASGDVARLA
jgi:hypothetical protein